VGQIEWEREALPPRPDTPVAGQAIGSQSGFPELPASKAMEACGRGKAPGPDKVTIELLTAAAGPSGAG